MNYAIELDREILMIIKINWNTKEIKKEKAKHSLRAWMLKNIKNRLINIDSVYTFLKLEKIKKI
jgi:hypothetical protein